MSSKNDLKIKELTIKVEEQQAKLGKKPKTSFITNAVFTDGADLGNPLNLNVLKKEQLMKLTTKLFSLKLAHEEAVKFLEMEIPLTVSNYPISDWLDDIKTRFKILDFEENQKKLDLTKEKLKKLLSEDARTELELENIEKNL